MPAFLVFCPQIISRSRAQANAGSPDTTPAISRLPRYPKQAHPIRSIQGQDDWPHDDETMKCAKEIRGKNEPLEKEPVQQTAQPIAGNHVYPSPKRISVEGAIERRETL
ncbi:hypothetical protein PSPO01_03037 [Paraphaeosphaeria sporulosa]